MTHESDKNIFRDARSQLNAAMKAADILKRHVEQCDCEGWKEDFHLASIDARKTIAATLYDLDMSVRKIVDKGARLANAAKHDSTLSDIIYRADSFLTQCQSFFEGTGRATLEQEQAEAEQRYYKNRRIDAACDADNAKDEEFGGPGGEGEKT